MDKQEDELECYLGHEEGRSCDAAEREMCKLRDCRSYCHRVMYFSKLVENLDWAVEEAGFDSRFFSKSKNYPYPIGAFSFGPYRLYGLHYGPDLFIAGNGGIKLVKAIKEAPHLYQSYKDIHYVAKRLHKRIYSEYRGVFPHRSGG